MRHPNTGEREIGPSDIIGGTDHSGWPAMGVFKRWRQTSATFRDGDLGFQSYLKRREEGG